MFYNSDNVTLLAEGGDRVQGQVKRSHMDSPPQSRQVDGESAWLCSKMVHTARNFQMFGII